MKAADLFGGYGGFQLGALLAGVDVAYEAATGERDIDWFQRAIKVGVHAVAAQDRDLSRLCFRAGVRWLRMPNRGGFKYKAQAAHILNQLDVWGWRIARAA